MATPILTTRIPEGRAVPGLEYGAHVSRQGWTGYHVRPAGSGLPFGIARQTPAADELPENDEAIVGEIGTELRHFVRWCERYGYDPETEEAVADYQEARENLATLEGSAAREEEPIRLTVTLSGPNGEVMPGDHEAAPESRLNDEALRAAREAVVVAHEQLDQDTRAEGPEHWEGWIVEVHHGDRLLYQESVDQLLGELLPQAGRPNGDNPGISQREGRAGLMASPYSSAKVLKA